MASVIFAKSYSCFQPQSSRAGVSSMERGHESAIACLKSAGEGFVENREEEILAIDIRRAAEYLGEITGETADIDVLDRIFSRFCIGK